MVLFNYSTKEITAKIVYYGPGLCGKTTNLQFIYDNLPTSINKGKMLSLATKTDRTLFFDFLPIDLGTIRGMKTRLQLYTVPGQVFYNTTRKLVLKGCDGVVFVADSQRTMLEANIESFKNLEENLAEHDMNLSEMPLIVQFNKRDLPDVMSIEELNASINVFNAPIYEAVATTGIGVHETLKAATRLVLNSLRTRYADSREDSTQVPARVAAAAAAAAAGAKAARQQTRHKSPAAVGSHAASTASTAGRAVSIPPAHRPSKEDDLFLGPDLPVVEDDHDDGAFDLEMETDASPSDLSGSDVEDILEVVSPEEMTGDGVLELVDDEEEAALSSAHRGVLPMSKKPMRPTPPEPAFDEDVSDTGAFSAKPFAPPAHSAPASHEVKVERIEARMPVPGEIRLPVTVQVGDTKASFELTLTIDVRQPGHGGRQNGGGHGQ